MLGSSVRNRNRQPSTNHNHREGGNFQHTTLALHHKWGGDDKVFCTGD